MYRKIAAEFIGVAFLVAAIIGSGIVAERLSDGNPAITLLVVSMVCGAILIVTILMLGNISGAHLNPAVTLAFVIRKEISGIEASGYIVAQIAGAIFGAALANFMFQEPTLVLSTTARTGIEQWVGELVATFGLVAAILGCLRAKPEAVAYVVGLFIMAGFWFTSSGSFANPAVTIGRSLTDSFTGIMPAHAPGFIVAEFVGAILATMVFGWILHKEE